MRTLLSKSKAELRAIANHPKITAIREVRERQDSISEAIA
jgi:hypothetical protein